MPTAQVPPGNVMIMCYDRTVLAFNSLIQSHLQTLYKVLVNSGGVSGYLGVVVHKQQG